MGNRYTDWPEEYAARSMDTADAIRLIRPGESIVLPVGSLTPGLAQGLWEAREEVRDIDLYVCAPFFDPGWFTPGHENIRTHVEFFSTPPSRQAMDEGRTDFTSVSFSTRHKTMDERGEPVHKADVTFISVSPPDRFGYCSFGLSVWNKKSFADRSRLVLAEVHEGYPRVGGDSRIHVSEIDAFVPAGQLPPTAAAPPREDVPREIAGYVNELIKDGDTIQIGTGGTSNTLVVNGALEGKHDLGVHAELSIPGMTNAVREGIITCTRKNFHPGKYITTQIEARTAEDLEFIDENPIFEIYDVTYVNDPRVAAQNDNLICINNTLAVDFYGQITAESVDGRFWSGPGGQQDFVLAAAFSKGGRSVSVQLATADEGRVSRIMPRLPEGTIVTVPRQLADYVVTEFGIASLFGKSDRERAYELIAIAHPDHREELRRAAANWWVLPEAKTTA